MLQRLLKKHGQTIRIDKDTIGGAILNHAEVVAKKRRIEARGSVPHSMQMCMHINESERETIS